MAAPLLPTEMMPSLRVMISALAETGGSVQIMAVEGAWL